MENTVAFGDERTIFLWDDDFESERKREWHYLFLFADTTAWQILFLVYFAFRWAFSNPAFRTCGTNI